MLEEIAKKGIKGFLAKSLFFFLGITSKTNRDEAAKLVKDLHLYMPGTFSQIYDSGSCLGRELDNDKIKQMLSDNSMTDAYIRRGLSEIHWEGKKLNHFELIKKINKIYPEVVKRAIDRIKGRYKDIEIENCIDNIDSKLPYLFEEHKLPIQRKEFVIKLIALRVKTLLRLVE
jgi:hypothetical protein